MSNPTKLKNTSELLEELAAIQSMGRESLYRRAAPEAAPTAWGRSIQGFVEPARQALQGAGDSVREGIYGILPEGLRPSHINEKENKLLGNPPSVKYPGMYGDSRIAGLTPEQQMLLKMLGGSGRINPDTKLPGYDDGDGSWGDSDSTGAGDWGGSGGPGASAGAGASDDGPGWSDGPEDTGLGPDSFTDTGPDNGFSIDAPVGYEVSNLAPPPDSRTFEEATMMSDRDPSLDTVDWEGFQAGKDLEFTPGVKPGFWSQWQFDAKKAKNEAEEWFFQGKPGPFGKPPGFLGVLAAAVPFANLMMAGAQKGMQAEMDSMSKNEFGRDYVDLDPQERSLMDQAYKDMQETRDVAFEAGQNPSNGEAVPTNQLMYAAPQPKYVPRIASYQSGSFAMPKPFAGNLLFR